MCVCLAVQCTRGSGVAWHGSNCAGCLATRPACLALWSNSTSRSIVYRDSCTAGCAQGCAHSKQAQDCRLLSKIMFQSRSETTTCATHIVSLVLSVQHAFIKTPRERRLTTEKFTSAHLGQQMGWRPGSIWRSHSASTLNRCQDLSDTVHTGAVQRLHCRDITLLEPSHRCCSRPL